MQIVGFPMRQLIYQTRSLSYLKLMEECTKERLKMELVTLGTVEIVNTVKDQKYFHNVRNSIDLRVFSWVQEKFSRFSWSTYFHDFGVI